MPTPSLVDVISNTLRWECGARCMDNEEDRKITVERLVVALREPLADYFEEVIECAVVCNLKGEEVTAYAQGMTNDALAPQEDKP